MRHGSLFNGIGGFQLAAHWMGWENVFHCEIDPFCNQVVKKHFPESICYEDIRRTDFTAWRGAIDILSGGFPCTQTSVSAAIHNHRKGLQGRDSSLWYQYLRAIDEIRSRWAIVENVGGVKTWNDIIQKGLEDIGYTVSLLEMQASDFGLPHARKRYFYVANANGKRLAFTRQPGTPAVKWFQRLAIAGGSWLAGTPGTIGVFNGLPNRVDRVKALGNAVCPAMARAIFKMIQEAEIISA